MPLKFKAKALGSAAATYSLARMARILSVTNGTVSAANFPPAGGDVGAGDGGVASAKRVGVGDGIDGADEATAFSTDAVCFVAEGPSSSLVKYRRPATQMATTETTPTTTGHNQC